MTCGCTALVSLIIERKIYTFHLGDCKSFLFRNQVLYKMNIDHLPVGMSLIRAGGTKGIGLKGRADLFNTIG